MQCCYFFATISRSVIHRKLCRKIKLEYGEKCNQIGKLCALTWPFLKSCWLCHYRTHTSRAVRTQCRILRARSWNLGLYSSSWHTWSRSKRRPSRGKMELEMEGGCQNQIKWNDEMLVRKVWHFGKYAGLLACWELELLSCLYGKYKAQARFS